MLSRHADAAFWIGRYVERAEATARMIDVHYHFGLESPYVGKVLKWESILAIADEVERFRDMYGEANERNIMAFFAFDPRNPNSISSCLRLARENGRSIRDQISSEMWEVLNRTYLEFQRWNVDVALAQTPFEFFRWVKDASHLFQGITSRTLMVSDTRDFHNAGRFLERADQTARILDVKYHDLLPRFSDQTAIPAPSDPSFPDPASVGGPVDTHGWTAVLKSVGAFEAFRKTYRRTVTPERVTEFLILNPQFPASVRYSVGQVDGALRRISGNRELSPGNAAERAVGRLYSDLNYTDASEIISGGLHEYLESVEQRCTEIGDAVHECYLRY